jgi:two-component system, LytTR family, response regulator
MNSIHTIIIDDEPTAIENLEYLLADMDSIKVQKTFTTPAKALDWLLKNQAHLIFLDVEMPQMTGFEFLEQLQKYPDKPCIIFTTGFAEYAIDAIKATAFDYLLKPVSRTELQNTLQRYRIMCLNDDFRKNSQNTIQQAESPKKIVFAHHRGFVAYQPDEILYIEADRNYSYVHLTNGKKQIVSMQLGQIEKAIPQNQFFRINRHTIINIRYFTHADQKLKKCYLEVNGQTLDFEIKVPKIKELMRVMMGG